MPLQILRNFLQTGLRAAVSRRRATRGGPSRAFGVLGPLQSRILFDTTNRHSPPAWGVTPPSPFHHLDTSDSATQAAAAKNSVRPTLQTPAIVVGWGTVQAAPRLPPADIGHPAKVSTHVGQGGPSGRGLGQRPRPDEPPQPSAPRSCRPTSLPGPCHRACPLFIVRSSARL